MHVLTNYNINAHQKIGEYMKRSEYFECFCNRAYTTESALK